MMTIKGLWRVIYSLGVCFIFGCSGNVERKPVPVVDQKIIGRWDMVKYENRDILAEDVLTEFSIVFTDKNQFNLDFTAKMNDQEGSMQLKGTYKINGKFLMLLEKGDQEEEKFAYSLVDDKLELNFTLRNATIYLVRVKTER